MYFFQTLSGYIYIPGSSSLGAKWFRYRVSIHHSLGFKDGTPSGRCWYIFNLLKITTCAMVKSRYIGDGHPTFNRNPYNGCLNPYHWVDDHPLLYGNNGSLDPGTHLGK